MLQSTGLQRVRHDLVQTRRVASLPRLRHKPKERKSRDAGFQRHQRKQRSSEPGPARLVGSRPLLTAEAPPTKLVPPWPP